jgi:hypothetical protein
MRFTGQPKKGERYGREEREARKQKERRNRSLTETVVRDLHSNPSYFLFPLGLDFL